VEGRFRRAGLPGLCAPGHFFGFGQLVAGIAPGMDPEDRERESESELDTRYEALRVRDQEERERIAEEVAADPLPDKHDDE
jgi:hypothetical protein